MAKTVVGPVDNARSGFAITPSDTLKIGSDPGNTKYGWDAVAVRVGTGGDLKVTFVDDDSPVILKNLADGEYLPGIVKQVWATGQGGTLATNLVGLAR